MKKIILILTISNALYTRIEALTLNVQNNTDGQIQLSLDALSQQALGGISSLNPFADIILDRIKQEANDRIQQGFEASTILYYGKGESGTTNFPFCPRKIKIQKLTGTGAGKISSFWTRQNCNAINLIVGDGPNGLIFDQAIP
ncbi:MAG: hypothetical protein AB7F19_04775 [Candidatus Babeliales bacterium]